MTEDIRKLVFNLIQTHPLVENKSELLESTEQYFDTIDFIVDNYQEFIDSVALISAEGGEVH